MLPSVPMGRTAALAALLGLLPGAGCEEEQTVPDPRFATPESTLDTLLSAYGVDDMSQEEIQRAMRARSRFELRDEEAYRACFTDYEGPQDEGLAGFVFGTVAAGKDDLRVNHVQGKAHVYPNPDRVDRRVVLVEREGEWKISLRESVPPEIREALLSEYRRISERNRKMGAPR